MKSSKKKWIFILIYLLISVPLGLFFSAITSIELTRYVMSIINGYQFCFFAYDYEKIIKASIYGGGFVAISCWVIAYYQNK